MSRLKELRLHGFKSFADPTRFVFEPGINAVIGPNGSGKSNMADAVRWVLGEQSNRSLRTRRADDVIFSGSDQRKAQGMAEAILTLDNHDGWLPIDFAEVAVGRRAYRSGESEYLINGARARLRDVVELLGEGRLGANELVVVGQGTVDAALSLRPEERRQLFEEAAGVKGLQVKRNEASSRLAKASDNLTRMNDLLGELKPQVRRLALQAQHQQEHDTLGARARALVSISHRRREHAARAALGEARRAAAAAESSLAALRESEDAGRREVSAAEARYWAAEEAARASASTREATHEALIRAESRLESIDGRLADLAATLERETGELAEAEDRLDDVDGGSGTDEITRALAAADAAEGAWRDAVATLAAADDALLAAEEAVASVRSRESDRIAEGARASEATVRHQARLEQAAREAEEVQRARVEAAAALEAARTAVAEASAASERAHESRGHAEDDRDAAQDAADRSRRELIEITERLQAMRAELAAVAEPHDAGSRLGRRLAGAGWPALLDSIEAPAESWPAIEAVVGGELEGALLWADHDPTGQLADAKGAARLLAAPGGATDEQRVAALEAVGGRETLADWVASPRAPLAFRRTVIAPDVTALLAGWRRLPAGWSAVTAEGDLADARGVVVLRGRADAPGGAAARAHARRRDLAATVSAMEAELAGQQQQAHADAERLRLARDAHLSAGAASDEADARSRRAREDLEATEARASRLADDLARLQQEADALDRDRPSVAQASRGVELEGELGRLAGLAAAARDHRDVLATRRDEARRRWSDARAAAEEVETRTAGRRGERAQREARVAQLRASLPDGQAALERLRAERVEIAATVTQARAQDEAAKAAHHDAEQARSGLRAELLELERDRGGTSARLGELEREAQAAAIEATRRDDAIVALARERELALDGLPEIEVAIDPAEIEVLDDDALEAEGRRVRRTLAQIGSVNPFAVEEHAELAGRLEEMTTQATDLRAAIGSTQELIERLDLEIGGQFNAAFRAIGERFDEYCQLLFAGGSGSLQMADEADGDAPGGIEIVVRPPGKRLQRLAMLSGGERALTGVALLFAMLTVNPVPFCILDEVDAALDEANIGRFAQALRKLSESIDFVVITHNRATIEVADTIYGVTMTDAAVSRLLSLRLADVPVEVGA